MTSKLLPAGVLMTLLMVAVVALFSAPQENRRRGANDQESRKYPEIPGQTEKSARALAVMVWLGDAKKITNPRLIPLFVYYKNQFNDANTYLADPYPLALTDGTVYEVQSHGEREGFFKVGLIHRIKADWIGLGQWMTEAEVAALKKPRPKRTHSADDDRPVMRRNSSGSGSSSDKKEQVNPEEDDPDLADAMSTDEDRPTLRRSKSSSGATRSGSAGSGSVSGSGSSTVAPEDNAADLAQELSSDANRPSLKHNAGPQRPDTEKMEAHDVASRKSQDEDMTASSIPLHLMVAVSDAGAQDSRSYEFKWNPGEEDKYRKLLTTMALKDLGNAQRSSAPEAPARKAGNRSRAGNTTLRKQAPQPELQDVRMQAFDLAFSNNPVIVFSATQRAPDSTLVRYVTLVTRTDAVGETDQIFSNVTASDRLDVTPRLLLVDAVDGYGSGRGDLLFQQISDSGTNFVLYRVERGNLAKVFEGGDLPGVAAAQ